jgi:hypothetical protein
MRWFRITGIITLICLAAAVQATAGDRLITIDRSELNGIRDCVEAVEAYGGRVKIVIPPGFLIADLPPSAEDHLSGNPAVESVYSRPLDPAEFRDHGAAAPHVITAWNNVYQGRAAMMGLEDEPSPDRLPLVDDIVPVEEGQLLGKPPGAKWWDTSEFMLGDVVLAVILPESDGSSDPSTEDWTQAEKDNVVSEIISGLDWYVTKAGWRPLTFYTVYYFDVPTSYEPITRSSSQESIWRSEVLTELGYATSMYEMANDLRNTYDADWAVLNFTVDSSNDADNCFSDGLFAYASLGGPRFVMTYGNDGWGIANMDAVMAHELSHAFYALDEYYSAGSGCTATSGYLAFENQNSEYPSGPGGCAINRPFCIMRSVSLGMAQICGYTRGQIGWNDADEDSVPDICDTCPETLIYAYSPDPCGDFTPTYAGSSYVERLPNQNPHGKCHDITMNRITRVQYRVDGGVWADASACDGAFDEDKEAYTFTTDSLCIGQHIVETRAFHGYAGWEACDGSCAVDTLTIEGSGVDDSRIGGLRMATSPNPFGPAVELGFNIPGDRTSGVPVSLRIFDVQGRQVARLVDGVRSPGPARVSWNGTYGDGRPAPSGIYFVSLTAGDSRVVGKLVLAR